MKKNYQLVLTVEIILAVLTLMLMFILPKVLDVYKSLIILFCFFYVNFTFGMGTNKHPGNLLIRYRDFKFKSFLIFDFETYPFIPIRLIFQQLFAEVIVGLLLWGILYDVYGTQVINDSSIVFVHMLTYTFLCGGLQLIVFIIFTIYDYTKLKAEKYVDIKFLRKMYEYKSREN